MPTKPCTHKSRLVSSGWSMSALPPEADIRAQVSRKSNKSSHRESIANSHSPTNPRCNATHHQANSAPKRHADNNGHGNRRGDRRLCRSSPMAASMRLQLPGQEMFCEAFCFFPDNGRWHKCSRGPSASLPQPHPWGPAIVNSAFAAPAVRFASKSGHSSAPLTTSA
jgi:hypothetical protein